MTKEPDHKEPDYVYVLMLNSHITQNNLIGVYTNELAAREKVKNFDLYTSMGNKYATIYEMPVFDEPENLFAPKIIPVEIPTDSEEV